MRERFDAQLERLNTELIGMGARCEDAIAMAVRALLENDDTLPTQVLEIDAEIDRKERDIEALCLKLLLQQQPVARDLRAISSALKMVSDMERIGDQAADIAEISRYIDGEKMTGRVHIEDMAQATIHMVTGSIDSFVHKDLELARAVAAEDDVVDRLFDQVKTELIGLIGEKPSAGGFCLDLLMVAKYLERIGDHAVNIAEWVEYFLTGSHKNQPIPSGA